MVAFPPSRLGKVQVHLTLLSAWRRLVKGDLVAGLDLLCGVGKEEFEEA
jgi:hypothetical protein